MKKNSAMSFLFFAAIIVGGNFLTFNIVHLPNQRDFVILFSLLVFYPVMRMPLVGIYLMFIIMPFIPFFRRLFYLVYSRPNLDPLIIMGDIILIIMVAGLFFSFREQMRQGTFRNRICFVVLCYFLLMTVRIFVYNELPLGTAIMRYRFYGPQVLLFFVGVLYCQYESHMRRLWGITLIVAVISVLYGLKQLMFGYSEAEKIWFASIDFSSMFIAGLARPFSFFSSPASFADYMLIGLVGVIAFSGWGKVSGKIALLLIPLFWAGTMITSVRSNWIGMALTFFVWFLLVKVKGVRARIIIMVIMAVLFIGTDVLQGVVQTGLGVGRAVTGGGGANTPMNINIDKLITQRADAIKDPLKEHSMQSRIQLWKYIFATSSNPQLAIFGRGVGVLNADSLYLTYLSDFGYPGLLLVISIIISFIVIGFRIIDTMRSPYAVTLARTVVTMNIVMAIISTTGSHISAFPGDTYFWFWNGVMVGLWNSRNEEPVTEETHETPADA